MEEQLRAIELRYEEIQARLNASETYQDPELVAKLNREEKELAPVVSAWRSYRACLTDKEDALSMMNDPELRELAQEEFTAAEQRRTQLEQELKILLLPQGPQRRKECHYGYSGRRRRRGVRLVCPFADPVYTMYAENRGMEAGGRQHK